MNVFYYPLNKYPLIIHSIRGIRISRLYHLLYTRFKQRVYTGYRNDYRDIIRI